MIKLGSKVRDIVTGFVGVAICRCEYLNGCTQYGIKPAADKDNKMRGAEYIDEGQLEVILKKIVEEKKEAPRPEARSWGGPSSDTPGGTSDQPDADDYYGSDPDDNWATR